MFLMIRFSSRCHHRLGRKNLKSGGYIHSEPCHSGHSNLILMPLKNTCSESALTRLTCRKSRSKSSSMIQRWMRRFHEPNSMQPLLKPPRHSQTKEDNSKPRTKGCGMATTWQSRESASLKSYDKMPFFSSSISFSICNHHRLLSLCQGSL